MNVLMARPERGFSLSLRGTSGEKVGARRILAGMMQSEFNAKAQRRKNAKLGGQNSIWSKDRLSLTK